MPERGTLEAVAEHLTLALAPLEPAASDFASFRALMLRLGWDIQSLPGGWGVVATAVGEAIDLLQSLGEELDLEDVKTVLDKVNAVRDAIAEMGEAPAGSDPAAFNEEIVSRLFSVLLVDYLSTVAPKAYTGLRAIGVIKVEEHDATDTRPSYVETRLDWDELQAIVADPSSLPRRIYGWGTPEFSAEPILSVLLDLAIALRLPAYPRLADRELAEGYKAPTEDDPSTPGWMLGIPVFVDTIEGQDIEVGVALLEMPAEDSKLPGLIFQPLLPSQLAANRRLSDALTLRVHGTSDLAETIGVVVRPGDLSIRSPFQPGGQIPSVRLGLALDYEAPEPRLLLGAPGATRLEIAGGTASFDLDFDAGALDFRLALMLHGLVAVVAGSEQDGFLGRLLGGADTRVPIPYDMTWSSSRGLEFAGSAGFDTAVSPHLEVGPIRVEVLHLRVHAQASSGPEPAGLTTAIGVVITGELGPVAFAVQEVGLLLDVAFAEGNAGPFDVEVGFKPPAGVGLSIDAGAVTGGGFLQFDHDQAQYVGALHLQFEEVAVNAIGILTTRLPGGQPGYSLVILVQASGFAPVQLGFGFSLTGVGGLLGINRGVNVDMLRAGIKSRALDPILFTRDDPVPRAGEIVTALQTVFPPTPDSYVLGPMAQIKWGAPPILTIEIALLLQLPAPLRLIILGRIKATLPDEREPLVCINLDALGVVDFDRREASVDAALYDSKLIEFALTGEMALRASWGENPQFALAVGGFHPRFQPPPGFPQLGRVALTLASGDNPRLRMEAYLALTSNTVQFGSRLDFYVAADQLSLEGMLGFDTLINLSPFGFAADIAGSLALKWGADVLFAVTIAMTLSGPNPWHARGRATFDLLGWKQSIEFETRFGEPVPLPEPELVDVGALLKTEAEKPTSWSAQLPSGGQIVTLSGEAPNGAVLVHPGGELSVTQRVVPLEREISTFGTSVPATERSFSLALILGDAFQSEPVLDYFARGQFWRLSDDERLAAPSFDRMPAGVRAGAGYRSGAGVRADIVYETKIVALNGVGPLPAEPSSTYALPAERLEPLAQVGAAGVAAVGRTGRAKYRGEQLGVALADTEYVVATSNLDQVAGTEVTGGSYTVAAEALREYAASHPGEELQIVARYEAERVA